MRSLSKDELLALLTAAKAKRQRDFLMFLVTFRHGLRVTETVTLQPDNFRDGYLDVQRLKGSMHTVQPLIEDANPLLNEKQPMFDFIQSVPAGQRVFPITRQRFWQLIREHGKTAGVPTHKLRPHALKHTCAMLSIKSAGVENVRQFLGHRSLSSTGAYLRVSDSVASAAVATALHD